MTQYPTVQFLVRHGLATTIAVSLLPIVAGMALALSGAHWGFGAAGLVAGAVTGIIVKSYVELVAIIADMLLPK